MSITRTDICLPQPYHCGAQQVLDVALALADAAPADRIEIVAVDEAAERPLATRFVAVDVIEGRTGVEAGTVAERHTLREQTTDPQVQARDRPIEPAWRGERKRRGQLVGLVAGIAEAIGIEQRGPHRRLGEAVEDELASPGHRHCAAELAEGVVIEARQDVTLLDRR